MPRWVSKRDGALLKLPKEPHNESDPQRQAAFVRQLVGHTFAKIIQKGANI